MLAQRSDAAESVAAGVKDGIHAPPFRVQIRQSAQLQLKVVLQLSFKVGRRDGVLGGGVALWSGTNKNRDVTTGPLARPLVCSFARTAHSFACSGLLASLAPSAALTRLLTSLTPLLVGK